MHCFVLMISTVSSLWFKIGRAFGTFFRQFLENSWSSNHVNNDFSTLHIFPGEFIPSQFHKIYIHRYEQVSILFADIKGFTGRFFSEEIYEVIIMIMYWWLWWWWLWWWRRDGVWFLAEFWCFRFLALSTHCAPEELVKILNDLFARWRFSSNHDGDEDDDCLWGHEDDYHNSRSNDE